MRPQHLRLGSWGFFGHHFEAGRDPSAGVRRGLTEGWDMTLIRPGESLFGLIWSNGLGGSSPLPMACKILITIFS
jgi:hypothetical protein